MKIAFVTTSLDQKSGWGRVSAEIISRVTRVAEETRVIVCGPSPALARAETLSPPATSLTDGWRKPATLLLDWKRFREQVADCEIVHCLVEPLAPLAHAVCPRGSKLVITLHGTYAASWYYRRWRWFYRRAFLAAGSLVADSQYTAAAFAKVAGQNPVVVPLGVTVERTFESLPTVSERQPAILSVGQAKRRKGYHVVCEAIGMLAADFPELKYYVVGSLSDRAYVTEIQARAAALGVLDRVVLLGEISESALAQLYLSCRALVMPSQNAGLSFEGFGLVHLEANAYGLPSIGSLDCGNEDAIAPGQSGFLVAQGDVDAVGSAIRSLLASDGDWAAISKTAYDWACAHSWEETVRRYLEIYRGR